MKTAIVVFTNNESLMSIGIEKNIPFTKKIIVSETISLFLLDDKKDEPNLNFSEEFDFSYVVFHENGGTDKSLVRKKIGEKLKKDLTLSHINNSGNYYANQVREVLKHVPENLLADVPWELVNIDNPEKFEKFLLKPFDDHGFEKNYALLNKLLTGEFSLTDEEKIFLTGKNFDLEAYKKSFNKKSPDWEMFDKLREQLFKNL